MQFKILYILKSTALALTAFVLSASSRTLSLELGITDLTELIAVWESVPCGIKSLF